MTIYVDDADRRQFLEILGQSMTAHDVSCHAYCLMANHYHIVVTTNEPNLAHAIHQVNSRYAEWWNARHARPGHVFQGRYGAQVIQAEGYLLTACRYVVLNPVRAGVVASPEQWRWSSYGASAGLEEAVPFLHLDLLWRLLGGASRDGGCLRYRGFVTAAEAAPDPLARDLVLGDQAFVEQFREAREKASAEVPRRVRISRPPLDRLFAGAYTRSDRARRASDAYQVGYTLTEIGAFLSLHDTTVRRMILGTGLCNS
jgi:putative transposase